MERFATAVHDVPESLVGEVQWWDLVSAVFLRTFYPSVWALIVRNRQVLTGDVGTVFDFVGDRRTARAKQVQLELQELLQGEPSQRDLQELLDALFPALASSAAGRTLTASGDQRIGDPIFVDRYLWLDLPPGALSEAGLRAATVGLPLQVEPVLLLIEEHPAQGMAVLERTYREGALPIERLFIILDSAFARRTGAGDSERDLQLSEQAAMVVRRIVPSMSADEVMQLLDLHPLVIDWPLLRYVLTRDRQLRDLPPGLPSTAAVRRWREDLAGQLRARLRSADGFPVDDERVRGDFQELWKLNEAAAVSVLRDRFEAAAWSAEDLATAPMTAVQSSRLGLYPWLDVRVLTAWFDEPIRERMRTAVSTGYPPSWNERPVETVTTWPPPAELGRQIGAFVLTTGRSFGLDPSIDADDLDA